MGNITILFGIGLVAFIFTFLFGLLSMNRDGEGQSKHPIIQILILAFIASLMLIAGKVALDDKDNCAWNVVNATVSGDTSTYGYEYQCSTNPNESAGIFYKMITWFAYFLSAYLFVFIVMSIWEFVKKLMQGRVQR